MATGTVSYQQLLEQCAHQHSLALKQLYELEGPHFLALGQSLVQRSSDAEELLRESFVLIWRNANAYDPSLGSAKAWLYSIFRFRAQQKRKNSGNLNPLAKAKNHFYLPASASTDLLQFQHLRAETRHKIALAYLYGFNYAEIAKACQCSIQETQAAVQEGLLLLTHLFTGWQNSSDTHLIVLGEYCLGLLNTATEASAAHQLLQTDTTAAQDLLLWEDVFSHLTACLPTLSPPAYVLSRIYQDLGLPLSQALAPSENPVTPKTQSTAAPTPSASLLEILHNEAPSNGASVSATPTSKSSPTPAYGNLSSPDPVFKTPEPEAPEDPPAVFMDPPPVPASFGEQTKAELAEAAYEPTAPLKRKTKIGWWVAGGTLAALSAFAIWAFMPKAPVVQLVQMSPQAGAVLQAPGQSATPGWILSVDAEGHVLLSPQVRTELEADQIVQLWTQLPNDTQIRSLGRINPNQPVTLPAELIGPVEVGQIFEMTLESGQGVSAPSGSILFLGRIVRFGEFKPTVDQSDI
ncbi:anti-sigma factor domain-containing protein [Paenalcaligenes hominis]|uniref:anti-sigma factor domain-containing protein n=1 Tax=Paenalcaligenes hominis TaxID=643674 RepID=UPI003523E7B5